MAATPPPVARSSLDDPLLPRVLRAEGLAFELDEALLDELHGLDDVESGCHAPDRVDDADGAPSSASACPQGSHQGTGACAHVRPCLTRKLRSVQDA